jgi:hypothetical protein
MSTATLTREMNISWDNQQHLVGSQASLDYIFSCSNRLNTQSTVCNNHDELNTLLTRTSHIRQVSSVTYVSIESFQYNVLLDFIAIQRSLF